MKKGVRNIKFGSYEYPEFVVAESLIDTKKHPDFFYYDEERKKDMVKEVFEIAFKQSNFNVATEGNHKSSLYFIPSDENELNKGAIIAETYFMSWRKDTDFKMMYNYIMCYIELYKTGYYGNEKVQGLEKLFTKFFETETYKPRAYSEYMNRLMSKVPRTQVNHIIPLLLKHNAFVSDFSVASFIDNQYRYNVSNEGIKTILLDVIKASNTSNICYWGKKYSQFLTQSNIDSIANINIKDIKVDEFLKCFPNSSIKNQLYQEEQIKQEAERKKEQARQEQKRIEEEKVKEDARKQQELNAKLLAAGERPWKIILKSDFLYAGSNFFGFKTGRAQYAYEVTFGDNIKGVYYKTIESLSSEGKYYVEHKTNEYFYDYENEAQYAAWYVTKFNKAPDDGLITNYVKGIGKGTKGVINQYRREGISNASQYYKVIKQENCQFEIFYPLASTSNTKEEYFTPRISLERNLFDPTLANNVQIFHCNQYSNEINAENGIVFSTYKEYNRCSIKLKVKYKQVFTGKDIEFEVDLLPFTEDGKKINTICIRVIPYK